MVCLMELSSHLIQGSEFDRYDVNEMRLAARLSAVRQITASRCSIKAFTQPDCCTTGRMQVKTGTGCCR
jgi:hypothetical protein